MIQIILRQILEWPGSKGKDAYSRVCYFSNDASRSHDGWRDCDDAGSCDITGSGKFESSVHSQGMTNWMMINDQNDLHQVKA